MTLIEALEEVYLRGFRCGREVGSGERTIDSPFSEANKNVDEVIEQIEDRPNPSLLSEFPIRSLKQMEIWIDGEYKGDTTDMVTEPLQTGLTIDVGDDTTTYRFYEHRIQFIVKGLVIFDNYEEPREGV